MQWMASISKRFPERHFVRRLNQGPEGLPRPARSNVLRGASKREVSKIFHKSVSEAEEANRTSGKMEPLKRTNPAHTVIRPLTLIAFPMLLAQATSQCLVCGQRTSAAWWYQRSTVLPSFPVSMLRSWSQSRSSNASSGTSSAGPGLSFKDRKLALKARLD
jgi:hypothetical protein